MNVALLKATWTAFGEDKAPRLAAAIAYSAIFSIAPLFIVLIAIVGWVVGVQNGGHGHHVAEDLLVGQLQKSAGSGTADTVRQMIATSFNKPRQSIIAQFIGWVTFVLGATALFAALQDALNAVWHVEATKGGWKQILRDRSAAFGMILIVGLLLLLSLVANVAISFLGSQVLAQIPIIGHPAVLAAIGQLITLGVVALTFAAIFKVLPDVSVAWRDVWVGAIATAVLFVAGEAAIALYFRYAGVASAYGAAGSLLVAILWIYYSAILLLLGAEFTKVYAGKVETVAPATIRSLTEHPAGVDPRVAGHLPNFQKETGMEKDPSVIRQEIEATRERMSDTVEALAYKTDVPARAKDAVHDRVESVKHAVSDVVDTARATLGGVANDAQSKVAALSDDAQPHIADLRASVGTVAGAARDAAVDASRKLPTGDDARIALSGAKRLMQDHPLGLAIGSIAVGLLLGSLLPVSALKRKQIGPIGENLTDSAKAAAGDQVDQGKGTVTQAVSGAFSGTGAKLGS